MNDKLYQELTLDKIRDFTEFGARFFSADDCDTIIVWLYDLSKELFKLREHFHRKRLGWKEQQKK